MEILAIIPVAQSMTISAVPPWLMNNNGIPDIGIIPSMEDIFMNDSIIMSIAIPLDASLANISFDLTAILNELKINSKNKIIKVILPRKPNSYAQTAKMESPIGSGKYLNFCTL